MSASYEVKRSAYAARGEDWQVEEVRPHAFGRKRSAQLWNRDGWFKVVGENEREESEESEEENVTYAGAMGMAALLTEDGYALTAAHVVNALSELDAVIVSRDDYREPVAWEWVLFWRSDPTRQASLKAPDGGFRRLRPLIHERPTRVGPEPIRLVKVLNVWDVALVKLPVTVLEAFAVRESPLVRGEAVFSSGHGATPLRIFGHSAGRHVRSAWRGDFGKVKVSLPSAAGDSGGPVYDAQGRLVGIVSHLSPSRWLPWPRFHHTSLRMVRSKRLQQWIAEDRAAQGKAPREGSRQRLIHEGA
jgi:hypothetical protein